MQIRSLFSFLGILPFALCLLCAPNFVTAQSAAPKILLSELASAQTWLKLLHYERDADSASGWRSAIHSSDFFLNEKGRDDPLLEMTSTLAAFLSASPAEGDKQAQCRFPARLIWLKTKLNDHPAFKTPFKCQAYEAWTRGESVSSLSIVFATGYLGNPASYYGHTLLKFNFKGNEGPTGLLDISVNYGAIVGKDVDPVTYILKSLSGGYDGGFSHIQFYYHNHNYGNFELRDLWEYKLDLPRHAVDFVVAHAWEVLGKRYTYHFFRLNCAYRMAEVLQVLDGVDLTPNDSPWVIPQALIQKMAKAQYQGKPLLAGISYLPSRQSRFYVRYRNLNVDEVILLEDLVQQRRTLQDAAFQNLPILSRQVLLDAMLDYYQFIGNPIEKAPPEVRQAYAKVLSSRYQLAPGAPQLMATEPASAHLGRAPGWLQAGFGYQGGSRNLNNNTQLSIHYRPAYYDALDSDSGHVQNSALIMADTQIEILRNKVRIKKFELLGVDSVNPGVTRLPGDNAIAMKVHVGAEQLRLDCRSACLSPLVQGDIGYGRQWSRQLFTAAYVGAALHANRAGQGAGFARASTDLIFRADDHFGAKISYEHRVSVGNIAGQYGVGKAEARWQIDSRSDFRMSYERDRVGLFNVAVGMYW